MSAIYQSHLQTAKNNYITAQDYYNKLRISFLQDAIQNYTNTVSDNSLQQLIIDLPTMVSDNIESLSKERMLKLIDEIQNRLGIELQKKQNRNLANQLKAALIKAVRGEQTTTSKTDAGNRLHRFQDRFETILKQETDNFAAKNAYDEIIKILQQHGLIGQKMTSAEYGFLKRNLLRFFKNSNNSKMKSFYKDVKERMFSDNSLIGYAKNLGGAYAEQMEADIVNKSIAQLGGIENMFQVTAEQGDSTNIHYDLISQKITTDKSHFLTNIANFLNSANQLHIKVDNIINLNEITYGIQSKQGWSSSILNALNPENQNIKLASFFSVGDRKQLANSLGFNIQYYSYWRGWHSSVLRLSQLNNFFQAVGQFQLGYFIQGHFIWMADLISTMHKNNLYLSFYYSKMLSKDETYKKRKYPTTGEVAWQAPEYNYKELSRARILQQALTKQTKANKSSKRKKK